ncbi:hypothetical protein V1512DRAFT_80209 [Lipomyces arxii]|uniref:uncharacterized protein n=1 Tax=Lipomyces arxii TaxID=56418 RepID=UPI0034CEDBBB
MSTILLAPIEELSVFIRPDPTLDVLEWPCIDLDNIAVYADSSTSVTDITDVDNDDDIDTYTLEGDVVQSNRQDKISLYSGQFKDIVGRRIRIYNVHTSILRKADSDAPGNNPNFSLDFQILGETCWYRCLSPSKEYRNIYYDIMDKSKFWTWITTQMADIPQHLDDDTFDLFQELNRRYRHDFNKIRFLGLLLKHHQFIISRLLKDKYWENDILLRSFLSSPEYGSVVRELSRKINDAAINVDETTSDFFKSNIKLHSVASNKRKRQSTTPDYSCSDVEGGQIVSHVPTSPRSQSVSTLFGKSHAVTVSSVLSFVVHRSANKFDAAAHVLVLYGPKIDELSVNNDNFMNNLKNFLEIEVALQDSDWTKLMKNSSCMKVFCNRIASHLQLIKSKQSEITDQTEYKVYVDYIDSVKALFEIKQSGLQALGDDKDGEDDDFLKKEVIITNEDDDATTNGSKASVAFRKSQKAVSRLRPFGSPATFAETDPFGKGNVDLDDDTFNGYLGDSLLDQRPDSSFRSSNSSIFNLGSNSWSSSSLVSSIQDSESFIEDGIQLKKSADEAMLIAITQGIQRRLKNAFNLPQLSSDVLSSMPLRKWSCPHDQCDYQISNANSLDGRELIESHYRSHADQYISAMEAVRLIGAGQHVENLVAKIDNMADLWSNEAHKLA